MLRVVDIAKILGVSHQRVHQIYRQGRLPEPAFPASASMTSATDGLPR